MDLNYDPFSQSRQLALCAGPVSCFCQWFFERFFCQGALGQQSLKSWQVLFDSMRLVALDTLLHKRGYKLNPITTLYYIAVRTRVCTHTYRSQSYSSYRSASEHFGLTFFFQLLVGLTKKMLSLQPISIVFLLPLGFWFEIRPLLNAGTPLL